VRYTKKRESNEESLKQVIDRMLKMYRLDSKLSEIDVVKCFQDIVGPVIMKYVEKIYTQGDKIVVKLKSSVVREELSYAKEKILKEIVEKTNVSGYKEILLK